VHTAYQVEFNTSFTGALAIAITYRYNLYLL